MASSVVSAMNTISHTTQDCEYTFDGGTTVDPNSLTVTWTDKNSATHAIAEGVVDGWSFEGRGNSRFTARRAPV